MSTEYKEMVWHLLYRSTRADEKQQEGGSPRKDVSAGDDDKLDGNQMKTEFEEQENSKQDQNVGDAIQESTCEVRAVVRGPMASGLTDETLVSIVINAVKSGRTMQVINLDDFPGDTTTLKADEDKNNAGPEPVKSTSTKGVPKKMAAPHSTYTNANPGKHHRPSSARRACCSCTAKKLACSGGLPCHLCATRGITCEYVERKRRQQPHVPKVIKRATPGEEPVTAAVFRSRPSDPSSLSPSDSSAIPAPRQSPPPSSQSGGPRRGAKSTPAPATAAPLPSPWPPAPAPRGPSQPMLPSAPMAETERAYWHAMNPSMFPPFGMGGGGGGVPPHPMHFAAERAHGLAMPASNSGTFRMSMASPPGANAAGAHTGPLANTSGYTHTNWQPSPGLGMPGAGPGDSWTPLHPACNDIRFPQMGTNGAGAMWQVPYPNYPPAQYFQDAPPQDEMPVPREVRMQSMPPGPDRLGALAAVSAEMGGNGQAKGPVGGESTDAGDVDRGAKGEEGDRVKEGRGAGENGSRRVSIEGNLASSRKRPLHEEGEDIDEGGRHRESTQLCDDGSKGVGEMGRRDEASRKGHEKGEKGRKAIQTRKTQHG